VSLEAVVKGERKRRLPWGSTAKARPRRAASSREHKKVPPRGVAVSIALLVAALCLFAAREERTVPEQAGGGSRAVPAGYRKSGGPSGSIIVRYARGARKDKVRAEIADKVEGARAKEVLKTANAEVYAVEGPSDAAKSAEKVPGVHYAEESRRGFALFNPGDTLYEGGKQWGPKQIDAEEAWDTSRGDIGPGPDVGVLDTGYFRHPDLADKVVSEYDCGNDDGRANPLGVHGTHVAGIVGAAAVVGRGVAGVAPGADLFVAQVFTPEGELRVENVVQCGDLAMKRGVKVINISLGFDAHSPLRLLQEAVKRWNAHGINVVAAAGNHASPYGYRGYPIYPAASDGVIGVAATTEAGVRWPFSSAGPWVDVAAPGEAIVSTPPIARIGPLHRPPSTVPPGPDGVGRFPDRGAQGVLRHRHLRERGLLLHAGHRGVGRHRSGEADSGGCRRGAGEVHRGYDRLCRVDRAVQPLGCGERGGPAGDGQRGTPGKLRLGVDAHFHGVLGGRRLLLDGGAVKGSRPRGPEPGTPVSHTARRHRCGVKDEGFRGSNVPASPPDGEGQTARG